MIKFEVPGVYRESTLPRPMPQIPVQTLRLLERETRGTKHPKAADLPSGPWRSLIPERVEGGSLRAPELESRSGPFFPDPVPELSAPLRGSAPHRGAAAG